MSKEKAAEKTLHNSKQGTSKDIPSLAGTKQKPRQTVNKKITAARSPEEQTKILQGFFTSTITPFALLDKDFNFIQVNEAYAKIWQHDTSYFIGKNRFAFDPSNVRPIFEEVVRTKTPYHAVEFPLTFVDHPERGKTYWNWNLTPLLNKNGEVEFLLLSSEDVTEKKKTRKALKLNEKRMRAVLKALPVGVWITDENGVIKYENPAARDIWKNTSHTSIEGHGEYKGRWASSGKYIEPGEWALARAIRNSETSINEEVEIEGLDGTHKIILNSAVPIQNERQQVIGAVVVNQDITERKETERRIVVTNTLLKLFSEKTTRKEYLDAVVEQIQLWSGCCCVGIRVLDKNGYIPYESYTGFNEAFWESECWISTVRDHCVCISVVLGNPATRDHRNLTRNGSFYCNNTLDFVNRLSDEEKKGYRGTCIENGYKSLAVIPIWHQEKRIGIIQIADHLEGKMPLKVVEFLESISPLIGEAIRRFSIESALREANDYNRNLIEVSLDPLVTISPDGKISDVNSATEAATGYRRKELIGTDFSDYFTDPEKARSGYQSAFKDDLVRDYELEIRHKDGQITPVLYNATVYKDETGKVAGVFAAARDITEKVRLEKEFRQAQKIQAIGTLAGGIAHDFNNIIAGIIGFTEMALEDVAAEDPLHRRLELVLKGAYRGRDLVKQILAFSRKSEGEKKPVSLGHIFNDALPLIRASLPSTIEIRKNILTKDDIISADQTQIHQVILNLCTNAAYAMRDKGGTLEIVLADENIIPEDNLNHGLKPGSYVRLTISDTGFGMGPEMLERIFDPFFTTKPTGEGTGLGLSVVHGIIKNHEGNIRVYSEPGKGSSFNICIPKIVSDSVVEVKYTENIHGGKESILVVDDEDLLIAMNKQRLERLGYAVTGSTSSVDALEIFRREPHKYDLVVTDYTMPHMTGLELSKELLCIRPDLSIIMCSGLNEPVPAETIRETGIREFFIKPVDRNEFAKTIRRVLDSKKVNTERG
jgi:PAS domain S-box-containing protein